MPTLTNSSCSESTSSEKQGKSTKNQKKKRNKKKTRKEKEEEEARRAKSETPIRTEPRKERGAEEEEDDIQMRRNQFLKDKQEKEDLKTHGVEERKLEGTLKNYKIPRVTEPQPEKEKKERDEEKAKTGRIMVGDLVIREETPTETESGEESENKKKAQKRQWKHEKASRKESDSEEERIRQAKREREDKCSDKCREDMPRNWCMTCKKRVLQVYRNHKDYNYQTPELTDMSLDWCMKRGIRKEIPKAQGQVHNEDIRRYRLFKRKYRFLDQEETIMRRKEGKIVDDAFYSFMNHRDPEGDLHINNWCPKLNPVFCKKTNNWFRCICNKVTPTGTVRQFVLHMIQNHSHIYGKEVECLECAAQGYKHKFLSPDALWRHVNNSHEKCLMVGHLKANIQPEFQSNNDCDRWMQAFSQLIVAATIDSLHKEGSLTESFFRKERKEEEIGGEKAYYQHRQEDAPKESSSERWGGHRSDRH